MFELIGFWILVSAIVVLAAGQLWLVVRAFGVRWWWGLLVLFVPFAPFVFMARHWPRARRPTGIILLGLALAAVPYGVNAYLLHAADFRERDKIVEGERHLTLTGWGRTDYSVIRLRPDTAVLQMANPDVTDETLEILSGLNELKELDLNDTQVTDAGLKTLATLPKLSAVRLSRTKITDAGFRETLAPLDALTFVEVRRTGVQRATVKEWQGAKPGRRGMP